MQITLINNLNKVILDNEKLLNFWASQVKMTYKNTSAEAEDFIQEAIILFIEYKNKDLVFNTYDQVKKEFLSRAKMYMLSYGKKLSSANHKILNHSSSIEEERMMIVEEKNTEEQFLNNLFIENLNKLTKIQKKLIHMRAIEKKTFHELSVIFGITTRQAKQIYIDAFNKLKI